MFSTYMPAAPPVDCVIWLGRRSRGRLKGIWLSVCDRSSSQPLTHQHTAGARVSHQITHDGAEVEMQCGEEYGN